MPVFVIIGIILLLSYLGLSLWFYADGKRSISRITQHNNNPYNHAYVPSWSQIDNELEDLGVDHEFPPAT